jgi:hypothetical protein
MSRVIVNTLWNKLFTTAKLRLSTGKICGFCRVKFRVDSAATKSYRIRAVERPDCAPCPRTQTRNGSYRLTARRIGRPRKRVAVPSLALKKRRARLSVFVGMDYSRCGTKRGWQTRKISGPRWLSQTPFVSFSGHVFSCSSTQLAYLSWLGLKPPRIPLRTWLPVPMPRASRAISRLRSGSTKRLRR